jgi:hypothetical protein
VSASWRDIVAAEDHDPLTGKVSCGWTREASSAWAATAIFRLHVRHLGDPGIEHTITIEEPPTDPAPGTQLPLT